MITSLLIGWSIATIGLGYCLQRQQPRQTWRVIGWLWLLGSIGLVHWWTIEATGRMRLLALLIAHFYGIKTLIAVEARLAGGPTLGLREWLAFAGGWPGMRPAEFAHKRKDRKDVPVWSSLLVIGIGVLAVWFATLLREDAPRVAAFVFVTGFLCVLHLGGFQLVTFAFRRLGYAVQAPFRAPWRARSLQEFWAKRWNTGFSYLTSLAIYRPIANRFGRSTATWAGFLFSGLIHEVACSLPVRGGYGLPTAYFLLHGVAMHCEQRFRIPQHGPLAHMWTLGWVLLPAPLLFHGPLLDGVVLPVLNQLAW